MILVTICAIVIMMAVFASFYNTIYYFKAQTTNNSRVVRKNRSIPPDRDAVDYLSSGMMYVINILTNQGTAYILLSLIKNNTY